MRSGLERLGEWDVQTHIELGPVPKLTKLPTDPGIYSLYNSAGQVLYLGQAINLRAEVRQTLNRDVNFPVRRGPRLSEKAHPKY